MLGPMRVIVATGWLVAVNVNEVRRSAVSSSAMQPLVIARLAKIVRSESVLRITTLFCKRWATDFIALIIYLLRPLTGVVVVLTPLPIIHGRSTQVTMTLQ